MVEIGGEYEAARDFVLANAAHDCLMARLIQQPLVMECQGWPDHSSYRLLDSGAGRKYEAFGPYAFIRPEPQAMWQPRLSEWDAAGEFVPGSDEDGGGRWNLSPEVPDGWELAMERRAFHRPADTLPAPAILP